MDKYKCKNAFDLFTQKFEDPDEKAVVMGYVHRRDAYVFMGNQIAFEQTSLADELSGSVTGVVPAVRKNEIIINAFQRAVEEEMQKMWIEDKHFVEGISQDIEGCRNYTEGFVGVNYFDKAIPYLAVLWYNSFKESLVPLVKQEEVVVTVEHYSEDEPPNLA